MKTPVPYKILVERRVITTEILASVIYSLNKRAKNWKQKYPEKYRHAKRIRNYDLCTVESDYYDRKDPYPVLEYYKKKDYILMTMFKPEMIHVIDGVEYLYYRVHRSDFHLPGYIYELYGLKSLPPLSVKVVDDFSVSGEEEELLLSLQFCNRVFDIIKDGDFILIDGNVVDLSAPLGSDIC